MFKKSVGKTLIYVQKVKVMCLQTIQIQSLQTTLMVFTLMAIFSLLLSCASTKPIPLDLPQKPEIPETVTIRFGPKPGLKSLSNPPATNKEWALCGLFEYDHGNYGEAALAFESAAYKIVDLSSPFRREVLLAAAVSHLRDGNNHGFIRTMAEFLSSFNRWELIKARQEDLRIRILEEIYTQRFSWQAGGGNHD